MTWQEELTPKTIKELLTYRPPVTIRTIDFRNCPDIFMHRDVTRINYDAPHPKSARGRSLKPHRVKERAKRFAKREAKLDRELLGRPVEEWDMEELARGRPRNAIGTFEGRPPAFVTREVHELAMSRFKEMVKTDMAGQTITALEVINGVLKSDEVDNRGRALVSPSTKLTAAQFLIEHIIGKPVQHQTSDISVSLQGILGTVMVNPNMRDGAMTLAHLPGVTMPIAEAKDDDDLIIDA